MLDVQGNFENLERKIENLQIYYISQSLSLEEESPARSEQDQVVRIGAGAQGNASASRGGARISAEEDRVWRECTYAYQPSPGSTRHPTTEPSAICFTTS